MNETLAVLAGIGLAAACGLRVFLPLFVASLAVRTGMDGIGGFELAALVGEDVRWIGSTPALVTLGVATLLEVGAYYVPWLDNALDTIATPTAVVAGTLVAFAFFPGMGDGGYLDWVVAAIAGGSTAGVVQGGSVLLRGGSSMATGGFGNFAVSTLELIGSLVTALLAVVLPFLAGLLALVLVVFILCRVARLRRRRAVLQ